MMQYYNLYAGPEYQIHHKLASIQNIVVITFMYGAGMPILFVISAFAFLLLYISERHEIAKFYRQPPNFREDIGLVIAKEICNYSYILYFSMGFWLFTNRQIFENHVHPKKLHYDVQSHGHYILKSMFRISPGQPLLILLVLQLLYQFTNCGRLLCQNVKKKWEEQIAKSLKNDVKFVECKATYFSVLRDSDKIALKNRYHYLSSLLGINAFDHKMIHRMMNDNN